ncbi:hypothetical protein D3C83_189080 [compost metagenome]
MADAGFALLNFEAVGEEGDDLVFHQLDVLEAEPLQVRERISVPHLPTGSLARQRDGNVMKHRSQRNA